MSDETNQLPALPTTSQGWIELIPEDKRQKRLIDYVQQAFLAAIDDPEYNGRLVALVSAPTNKLSVEGSVAADKILAAELVQDKGVGMGLPLIGKTKIQVISNKLSRVLRRHPGASRTERRKLIG